MCEIGWLFHHVELAGASSETIQRRFGISLRVSMTFSTYASWNLVIAFGRGHGDGVDPLLSADVAVVNAIDVVRSRKRVTVAGAAVFKDILARN
jgi:hypothetical protein